MNIFEFMNIIYQILNILWIHKQYSKFADIFSEFPNIFWIHEHLFSNSQILFNIVNITSFANILKFSFLTKILVFSENEEKII